MYRRNQAFFFIVFIAVSIAVLHYLANMYYLYFYWWWYDVMMHVLGGFLFGGAALWFLKYEIPQTIKKFLPSFLFALIIVLVVGVSWEVFELMTGLYSKTNHALDTTLDLLSDIVGMLIAYVISKYAK